MLLQDSGTLAEHLAIAELLKQMVVPSPLLLHNCISIKQFL